MKKINVIISHRLYISIVKYKQTFILQYVTQHISQKFSFFSIKDKYSGPQQEIFLFNWDSLHARLKSHYEAWSYKKRSTKNITGYRKSV